MSGLGDAALAHAVALVRCASVTPHDAGAQDYLAGVLEAAGFTVTRLPFASAGRPVIANLYARRGTSAPYVLFAGHTDVVPPGDTAAWTHPPFAAEVAEGRLWGRGASDMKGGVAASVAAALDFLAARPEFGGSLGFLITGDEEAAAVDGTVRVVEWARARGEAPDLCVLAEPTSDELLGEAMKIGRRGSYVARLDVEGRQGHVAYPQRFANPLTGLVAAIAAMKAEPLDAGTAHFQPSNFEIVAIETGNPATNVVPARAHAVLNVRFNDRHTPASLGEWMERHAAAACSPLGLTARLGTVSVAECFYTEPGAWVERLRDAIIAETGRRPVFSTGGGASDGRFLKDLCPVVEFGLTHGTIHQVDENCRVDELAALARIYRRFLDATFSAPA